MCGSLFAAAGESAESDAVLQLSDHGFDGGLSPLIDRPVWAALSEPLCHCRDRWILTGLSWLVGLVSGCDQPVRAGPVSASWVQ